MDIELEVEDFFSYDDIKQFVECAPFDVFADLAKEREAYFQKCYSKKNIRECGNTEILCDTEFLRRKVYDSQFYQEIYSFISFLFTSLSYFFEKDGKKIENNYLANSIKEIGVVLMQRVKSFYLLFINHAFIDAISIARSIYEMVLSSHLLITYPELVEPYYDKERYLKIKYLKDLDGYIKDNEKRRTFKKLLEKYGRSLYENYGWTEKVFPKEEDRQIRKLGRNLNLLSSFRNCYSIACAYVHSSSFSVFNDSMSDVVPFCGWVMQLFCIFCKDFFSLELHAKKEQTVMIETLDFIFDRYTNSFLDKVKTI